MNLKQLETLLTNNNIIKDVTENDYDYNRTGLLNAFVQYALWNDIETIEELEKDLAEKFGEFNGMENSKLTETQKERLEVLFIESDLEIAVNAVAYDAPFMIGNDADLEDYAIEMLSDGYGAADFMDRFYNYIDFDTLVNDLVRFDDLPAIEFDGVYYYNPNI